MNIPTVFSERRIDDTTVSYHADSTFNGTKTLTARLEHAAGGAHIVWDDEDAVPHFLRERAEVTLGLTKP